MTDCKAPDRIWAKGERGAGNGREEVNIMHKEGPNHGL